jgi:hypothetical protein
MDRGLFLFGFSLMGVVAPSLTVRESFSARAKSRSAFSERGDLAALFLRHRLERLTATVGRRLAGAEHLFRLAAVPLDKLLDSEEIGLTDV